MDVSFLHFIALEINEYIVQECMYHHSLVFSLEGRAWQEPEPSHVIGMALAHCILGKFLGVVGHYFPPNVCILYRNVYILYIQYIHTLPLCISTSGIVI